MEHILCTVALTFCLAAGALGAAVVDDGGALAEAQAASTSLVAVPIDTDFRCFLCSWAGCSVANVGGRGCDDSPSSCSVVDWGCSEWPAGSFIAITW